MLKWFFGLSLHSRIAILAAPILAIGGYGLVDLWLNKDAPKHDSHIAMQQLVAEGQCMLTTNQCHLSAKNIKISLARGKASTAGLARIEIRVSQPVRGIKLALVHGEKEQFVVVDRPHGEDVWFGEFPGKLLQPSPSAIRLAVAQTGRISYAEIPAPF